MIVHGAMKAVKRGSFVSVLTDFYGAFSPLTKGAVGQVLDERKGQYLVRAQGTPEAYWMASNEVRPLK